MTDALELGDTVPLWLVRRLTVHTNEIGDLLIGPVGWTQLQNWLTCRGCRRNGDGFGPSHETSRNCQSGGRAHCTCDTCF